MLAFVQEYLDGDMDRMGFDLDFNHYLIKHYPSMERANRDLAECFNFYLAEEGFDQALTLDDTEHKKLIRKQWREFKAAMRDGLL
jgi:hypothetical protein